MGSRRGEDLRRSEYTKELGSIDRRCVTFLREHFLDSFLESCSEREGRRTGAGEF
jgi:hypothetical protein